MRTLRARLHTITGACARALAPHAQASARTLSPQRAAARCGHDAAIEVPQVHKRFGAVHALDGVSLEIDAGEFFGLLGPNGAGKTTLISILAGLARADAGSLRVMGYDVIAQYQRARRSLGVVPQELVFDPFFTVRETLRIQSGYFGLRDNDAWIDEIIERLDLTDKAHANMRQLSGGMKRRVLVAQALVHKPPVIILDEPTAGVDVELRQGLWRFIRELNQAGHTVVLTTHYLDEAEALCSRIAHAQARARCGARHDAQSATRRSRRAPAPAACARSPAGLACRQSASSPTRGAAWILALDDYAQIENVLVAICATKRIEVQELEVLQADLEDVFVQMMRRH